MLSENNAWKVQGCFAQWVIYETWNEQNTNLNSHKLGDSNINKYFLSCFVGKQ